jgi:hypothetical protein
MILILQIFKINYSHLIIPLESTVKSLVIYKWMEFYNLIIILLFQQQITIILLNMN